MGQTCSADGAQVVTPDSLTSGRLEVQLVKDMILSASKQGFVDCVAALCDSHLTKTAKRLSIAVLCRVVEDDSVFPAAMPSYTKTVLWDTYVETLQAGHLLMSENSRSFVQAMSGLYGEN